MNGVAMLTYLVPIVNSSKMTWFIKSTSIICQAKKEIRPYRVEAFGPAGRKASIKIIAFVKKKIDIIPFLD